jgi:hypothetical protein
MTAVAVTTATVRAMSVAAARVPWARRSYGAIDLAAGYADDPPTGTGLAHLTEHVCVAMAARQHGVTLSGRTNPAATRYSAAAADPDRLVRSLVSPLVPAEHPANLHAAETQAVLTELAGQRDQPQLRVAGALAALAFPDLDVALRDGTTEATLATIRPGDVTAFRSAAYRPATATLCVAGPHDPDRLLATVEDELGSVPPGGPDLVRQHAARPLPEHVAGWSDCVLWAAPTPVAADDEDRRARQVAVEILVGTSGLLDQCAAGCGVRSTGVATLPGRAQDLLVVAWPPATGLAAALRRVPDPPAALIDAARERVRTRIGFEQQTPSGIVAHLLPYALSTGPWPDTEAFGRLPAGRVAASVRAIVARAAVCCITGGVLRAVEEGQ